MKRGYAVLVLLLVASALLLVWWAPWSSSADPVERAREAFGNQRVVHVVARIGLKFDGSPTYPIFEDDVVEMWNDQMRGRVHVVDRRKGKLAADLVAPAKRLRPSHALDAFVLGYRRELADASLRKRGTGRIQGRRVVWLRSHDLWVAIDPVSYRPLWLRSVRSDDGTGPLTHLVAAETIPFDSANFILLRKRKGRHL